MIKYKKVLSLFVLVALMGTLAACGQTESLQDKLNDDSEVTSDKGSKETVTEDTTSVADSTNETDAASETREEAVEAETDSNETNENDTTEETPDTSEFQDYIDVEFVDKDGNVVKISDFEGKFIALNFFGVWCHYCMEEKPALEEFYKNYEGDDFVLLLVNATTTENIGKEGVIEWYEESGYTMPMVLDLDGVGIGTYPITGYPTTYFINKEGKILGAVPGMMDGDMLTQIMDTYNK